MLNSNQTETSHLQGRSVVSARNRKLSSGARRHHAVGQNAIREAVRNFIEMWQHFKVVLARASHFTFATMTGSARRVPSLIAMN